MAHLVPKWIVTKAPQRASGQSATNNTPKTPVVTAKARETPQTKKAAIQTKGSSVPVPTTSAAVRGVKVRRNAIATLTHPKKATAANTAVRAPTCPPGAHFQHAAAAARLKP